MVSTTYRLGRLRELMRSRNLTALIVPSEDEHGSEYLACSDELRAYISGFTGSAGTAIVRLDEALMFTDGRYYLQARDEMDDNWTLMKLGIPGVPTAVDYALSLVSKSTSSSQPERIGFSPKLLALSDFAQIKSQYTAGSWITVDEDLVGKVWEEEGGREKRPCELIMVLGDDIAGKSVSSKLDSLRSSLEQSSPPRIGTVLTALDEIAWLFNLRGFDIPYNPVFFSYAIVTTSTAILFLPGKQQEKLSADVRQHLVKEGVSVESYESFWSKLSELKHGLLGPGKPKIALSPRTSFGVARALGMENYHLVRSSTTDAKAIKNAVEIEGFRRSHLVDGAALVKYFAWLEAQLEEGKSLNEYDAASQLETFRQQGDLFRQLSFPTISSSGPNAAIIHYNPPSEGSTEIRKDQIYLCDSGAHYTDGTTDVTRTLHFGTPTDFEKEAFTLVLQGHIALDQAVFPTGYTGYQLDVLARQHLWQVGLDYGHGTGHGVGHFAPVHEGPQGVGTKLHYNDSPLKAGMVLSNEPGYYEPGSFGIRIESIVIIQPAKTSYNFNNRGFLCFEQVTLCPIQTSLMDLSLMSTKEKEWVNAYHRRCLDSLGSLLKDGDDDAKRGWRWLQRACEAI